MKRKKAILHDQEARRTTREAIMATLDTQIATNDPPETRQTLYRLLERGIDEEEARRLIACAIASEIFAIMKHKIPYDQDRYVTRLRALPEKPFLEDE